MINKDWELILNSFHNNLIIPYFGDYKWFNEITKFESLDFEHLWPDLIWISEKKIYWIEHFYVDASKKSKKWNELKVEEFREIKKNIIPNIEKDLETKNISSNSYKFKSILTYKNLKNNIYSNFDEHYKKIEEYNQNINAKYGSAKSIKIIFFIELNTLISAYTEKWNFIRYIYPFNDINFLNYFSDKKAIKWIIFSVNSKNYYIPIINKYIIDNKHIFDFTNWKIEDFKMNKSIFWVKL